MGVLDCFVEMGEGLRNVQAAAVRMMRRAQWFLMSLPMVVEGMGAGWVIGVGESTLYMGGGVGEEVAGGYFFECFQSRGE